MVERPELLRAEAARAFVEQIAHPVTKALVEIPYREVLRRFEASEGLPKDHFDVRFFVEGLFLSSSCHERIQCYLDGADHRWFPEDDDAIRDAAVCPLPSPREPATGILQTHFAASSFFRAHEAKWLLHSYEDVAKVQIVGVTIAGFYRLTRGRPVPGEPEMPMNCPLAQMDLLFCTEVLLDFTTPLDRLRSILSQ